MRDGGVIVRGRAIATAARVSLSVCCAVTLVVPCQAVAELSRGRSPIDRFQTAARSNGLNVAQGRAQSVGVTASGLQVAVTTAVASTPVEPGLRGVFFRRLQSYQVDDGSGTAIELTETEVNVGREGDRVVLEISDRFAEDFDELSGGGTGLGGVEIVRRAEFDMLGFDRLVEAMTFSDPGHEDRPAMLASMLQSGEISYENYEETVTVVRADGSSTTMSAEDFALSRAFEGGGAGGAVDCTFDCFADNGAEISFFGAVCIVSGAVVCAAGCAVTAGAACIPCLSAVSLGCGVSAAVGGIGICLASCIFGVDPPTPTRRPTNTRTPTPTYTPTPVPGDCDGDRETSIAELVLGVSFLLNQAPPARCNAMDLNRDGRVDISEIVRALRGALTVR